MEGLEKQLEQLDHAISKNYEKVIRLEKYMGFEPTIAKDSSEKQETQENSGKQSEQELYEFAKKLFDDGEKENARIQFENFINRYPDSDNADNARFWIADSYYSEKWFEKAILEYQEVLEKYPDSNKIAAARLKQGYAFAELGEKANARLILKELLKKHPDSNEAKYAQKKLKTLK
jgi:tol-pal system protein YbgF